MKKFYTGIGSRVTPEDVQEQMMRIASAFAISGWVLRSGGAKGADWAFESGCFHVGGWSEIYLPWKGMNGHLSPLYEIPQIAYDVAADTYGPSWRYLKPASKKFMARDVQQVAGKDIDSPSRVVICWTPDGCTERLSRTRKTGGTGQAIAFASELSIPVFNLKNGELPLESIDEILSIP